MKKISVVAFWCILVAGVAGSAWQAVPSDLPSTLYTIGYPILDSRSAPQPIASHGMIYHKQANCPSLAGHRLVELKKSDLDGHQKYSACSLCWPPPEPVWMTRWIEWRSAHWEEYLAMTATRSGSQAGRQSQSAEPANGQAGRSFTPVDYSGNGIEATVQAKVTETNDTWWRVSWRLTARNTSAEPKAVSGSVEFLDGDGFPVDDTPVPAFAVPAGSTDTQTGFALVNAKTAPTIVKVGAKLSIRK